MIVLVLSSDFEGKLSEVPHTTVILHIQLLALQKRCFFQDEKSPIAEKAHSETPEDCPVFQSELCCHLPVEPNAGTVVASVVINVQRIPGWESSARAALLCRGQRLSENVPSPK